MVKVIVKGAVLRPGTYSLSKESNVAQAILEAGGLTDRAILDTVDLKATLRDNMTIVVPTMSRPSLADSVPTMTTPNAAPARVPKPMTAVTPGPGMIIVVVKGAVAKPGAYQLLPGSVIASAIVASGGLASNADIGALNLQQPLRQGMTVTVPAAKPIIASMAAPPSPLPKMAQPAKIVPEKIDPTPGTGADTTISQNPVNINSAGVAQLQRLPGVGPSLAARIVTYRNEVGAFRAPEQLMDVKGITPEKFSEIQSLVRID